LLCEYDALPGMGHGCAHHIQGPAIVGRRKHQSGDERRRTALSPGRVRNPR
jgi:hypothetical protein